MTAGGPGDGDTPENPHHADQRAPSSAGHNNPAASTAGLSRTTARGVGVVLAAQLIRAVVQFGTLIALARLLSPADFGVVAAVTAVIGVADVLRDFGLSAASIQAKVLTDDERTNLFWANLAFGFFCSALVASAAPLMDHIYHQPLHQITLALSVMFVVSGANTQFSAELSRALRFSALAVSGIVAQVVGAACGIALAAQGAGYWAIVAQQMITGVVQLTMNVVQCRWRPMLPRRNVSIKRFFRFGINLFASQLIAYGTENVDNITVGVARGTFELGYYNRAYQLLVQPLTLINAPMTKVALPVLSRVQDDDVLYSHYVQRAQLVGCYLTATVMAVACGLSDPVVAVLFGPGWAPVAPIFALLAVGGIFRAVEQISYWMFLSRGKTGAQLRLYALTRPLMIGIVIAGVPWGAPGVAAASSIAYFLYWVISLRAAGRATGVDVGMLFAKASQAILMVSAPCGLAAFGSSLLVTGPLSRLVVGLAGAALYLVAVIGLVPRVRTDAAVIARFAGQAIARTPRKSASARHRER